MLGACGTPFNGDPHLAFPVMTGSFSSGGPSMTCGAEGMTGLKTGSVNLGTCTLFVACGEGVWKCANGAECAGSSFPVVWFGLLTIARITVSGTPADLSSMSAAGEVSKAHADACILAMMTSGESPAFTIPEISLLVSSASEDAGGEFPLPLARPLEATKVPAIRRTIAKIIRFRLMHFLPLQCWDALLPVRYSTTGGMLRQFSPTRGKALLLRARPGAKFRPVSGVVRESADFEAVKTASEFPLEGLTKRIVNTRSFGVGRYTHHTHLFRGRSHE